MTTCNQIIGCSDHAHMAMLWFNFILGLSNDPHIGMFSFLHRECINLHEGRLRNKIHLHSTLKGCFFVLKDSDQSQ